MDISLLSNHSSSFRIPSLRVLVGAVPVVGITEELSDLFTQHSHSPYSLTRSSRGLLDTLYWGLATPYLTLSHFVVLCMRHVLIQSRLPTS